MGRIWPSGTLLNNVAHNSNRLPTLIGILLLELQQALIRDVALSSHTSLQQPQTDATLTQTLAKYVNQHAKKTRYKRVFLLYIIRA